PAVILAVIAIVAYGVNTVRHLNAAITNPPDVASIPPTVVQINPKNVTYEVFGSLGGSGKVTYADLNSQPIEVTLASLPWSYSQTTMASSASLSLVAQVEGDSVGCRILVDGKVRDEQSVSHEGAPVACTGTAACPHQSLRNHRKNPNPNPYNARASRKCYACWRFRSSFSGSWSLRSRTSSCRPSTKSPLKTPALLLLATRRRHRRRSTRATTSTSRTTPVLPSFCWRPTAASSVSRTTSTTTSWYA